MPTWDTNLVQEPLQQSILEAIISNNVIKLKSLIPQIITESQVFLAGELFLMAAVEYGAADICTCLIDEYFVNVNCIVNKKSPILHAYNSKRYEIVKLLRTQHRANTQIVKDIMPLSDGINAEDLELIDLVINIIGTDPNQPRASSTPIRYAIKRQKWKAAEHLIRQYHVKLSEDDLLHYVAETGLPNIFDLFISGDLDVNQISKIRPNQKRTPLVHALEAGHITLAKHIIQHYSPTIDGSIITHKDGNMALSSYIAYLGDVELFESIAPYVKNWNVDVASKTALTAAVIGGSISILKQLLFTYNVTVQIDRDAPRLIITCLASNNIELLDVLMQHPIAKKSIDYMDSISKLPPILIAAKNPSLDAKVATLSTLKHFIQQYGARADCKWQDGTTLLHLAAAEGDNDFIDFLFSVTKMKVDITDVSKYTPLLSAAQNSQWHTVKYLITKYNADHTAQMHFNYGILHFLAFDGNITVLDEIMSLGVKWKIDVEDGAGMTPALRAAVQNNISFAKHLITTYKADPNKKDKEDNILLHLLAKKGDVKTMDELMVTHKLKVDADDKYKNTPGITAAQHGHWEFVKKLLFTYKADGNQKNSDGVTILHYVSELGDIALLDELMSKCPKLKVNIDDSTSKTTLLRACEKGHFLYAKHLVDNYKCDIHDKDDSNQNILHYLAKHGDPQLLLQFTNYKLKSEIKGLLNETPLLLASKLGRFGFVCTYLENFKSDVNEGNILKWTPLHYLAQKSNEIIYLNRMIACKAKLDVRNDDEMTPLLVAAVNKNWDICLGLLQCGADGKYYPSKSPEKHLLYLLIENGDLNLLQRFMTYDLITPDIIPYIHTLAFRPNDTYSTELFHYLHNTIKFDFRQRCSQGLLPLFTLGQWAPADILDMIMSQYQYNETELHQFITSMDSKCSDNRIYKQLSYFVTNYNAKPTGLFLCEAANRNDEVIMCHSSVEFYPPAFQITLEKCNLIILTHYFDHFLTNMSTYQTKIAIMNAIKQDNIDVVQYILPKLNGSIYSKTAEHIATAAAYNSIKSIQYLSQNGYDVHGDKRWVPILAAVKMGSFEALQLLIDLGTRTDIIDKDGRSILFFAIKQCARPLITNTMLNRRLQIFDFLYQYETNRLQTNDPCTDLGIDALLLYAAKKGTYTGMNYLISKYNANQNYVTPKGKTIVYYALKSKDPIAIMYAESIYLKYCPVE